ncbi:hypothetical protein OsJ_07006 [Oryza sativa Japonica Group]|uniref:Uncharacterized protein n=1 Tax=Oryza sativa subsp. japonica TaxID=39947 RepID=A3A7M0_ORYSJ|nr:hypothetical protein OsJ_07006 [Oryza sativa Japonica Group]
MATAARAASCTPAACAVLVIPILVLIMAGQVRVAEALSIGVNYGQIANNLPSPSRVSWLLRSLKISKVKLFDADPHVLRAFLGTGVEFVVGIGNEAVPAMASPAAAESWLQLHVVPHLRAGARITCITVGNEALGALGLQGRVNVTTAHSLDIMGVSYPPSAGAFHPLRRARHLQPVPGLPVGGQGAPFLINCYPYFAYKDDPGPLPAGVRAVPSPTPGVVDPGTRLVYDNMLYAQVDAVYAAIQAMGHTDIDVKVSETGWPSRGDPDEAGATPENAGTYIGNLLRRIEMKQGTPLRPQAPIDVYVFALFNENLKPGPASERNYGLFYPDGTPVYNVGLRGYLPPMASHEAATQVIHWFLLIATASVVFALS